MDGRRPGRVGRADSFPGASRWDRSPQLVGGELPKDMLIAVIGTAVALGGLTLGWFVPRRQPARPAARFCREGFPYRRRVQTVRGPTGARGGIRPQARSTAASTGACSGVSRAGLAVARVSRDYRREGYRTALLFALVRGMRDLGRRARRLQTGLVHKELLLAVTGRSPDPGFRRRRRAGSLERSPECFPLVSVNALSPATGCRPCSWRCRVFQARGAHAVGVGGLRADHARGDGGCGARGAGAGFVQVEEVSWMPSLGVAYRVGGGRHQPAARYVDGGALSSCPLSSR